MTLGVAGSRVSRLEFFVDLDVVGTEDWVGLQAFPDSVEVVVAHRITHAPVELAIGS